MTLNSNQINIVVFVGMIADEDCKSLLSFTYFGANSYNNELHTYKGNES